MQVSLFKKISNYTDKDGQEKTATNFYVQCNDALIPVEVKFFPDSKFGGSDPNFRGRKMTLSAFADTLPDKAVKKSNVKELPHMECPNCHQPMRLDDKDIDSNGKGSYWWMCDKCNVSFEQDTDGNIFE